MKHNILISAMLLFCLVACQKETQSEGKGFLDLGVSIDSKETLITKSGELPVMALKISDMSGNEVAFFNDYREVGAENPIEIYSGKYLVEIFSEEYDQVGWNLNPFYGSTEVNIKPFVVNTAEVAVKRGDFKVSVEVGEGFFDKFPEFSFTAKNYQPGKPSLVFSNIPNQDNPLEATLDNIASFPASSGKLNIKLVVKNTAGVSSTHYMNPMTMTGIKAGEHYHFKVSLSNEPDNQDGKAGFNLYINDRLVEIKEDFGLDFTTGTCPSITALYEYKDNMTIPLGDDNEKKYSFNAKLGIKSLKISSTASKFSDVFQNGSVELINASEEELSKLTGLGFSFENVAESATNECIVDVSKFVASLSLGVYSINFRLTDMHGRFVENLMSFEITGGADAAISEVSAWARFANAKARVYSETIPAGLCIQYRKAGETEWTSIAYEDCVSEGQYFSKRIDSLDPETEYEFRTWNEIDGDTGKVITLTTEKAEIVPNLNFDDWYQSGKAWYPNANGGTWVWDTANQGTASMGIVPTTPEESDVVSGKAARLQTSTVFGMLAAGNVYMGKFAKVSGLGAELDWGYSFNSRPLALRGYYKYAPKAIDKTKDPYTGLSGQTDQCSIIALLTDWDKQFHINTSSSVFVDYENDKNIIAFGDLYSSNTDAEYVQFTIPLTYRTLERIPNYIVIVGAASRYGDYFTGGVGSVLLLDEFELIYDPAELTEEEYAKVFENFIN